MLHTSRLLSLHVAFCWLQNQYYCIPCEHGNWAYKHGTWDCKDGNWEVDLDSGAFLMVAPVYLQNIHTSFPERTPD